MALDRQTLIRLLESVHAGPAWHGPSVRASLRGVTDREAARRAGKGRHSIHELVLHLAYSRYLLRHRLTGDAADGFARPLARSWWPAVTASFKEDRALLETEQQRLVDTVRRLPLKRFAVVRHARGHTLADELLGHVVHDGYHAGQIILARKLTRPSGR